ncbi:MAG: 4-hydroxyphenylpyruvate dioxygenase [Verrucomicrobia bacterium]|jgi:2-keto-myo-inositol isomerase|nr:MAG: 4-hydroxyphenylpyruvate dioxygenase [Verrucomicrobiota bacterium]
MNINRLGLNTVSIKFSNLEEMAAAAAGAGFRTIECPLDQIRRELAKGMTPAQARAIINGHQLTVSGGFNQNLVGLGTPAEIKQNQDEHVANAELIAQLGGSMMVVGTDYINWPAAKEVPNVIERMAEAAKGVADRIKPLNVTMAIEFNWGMVKTFLSVVEIAKRSGAANIGVLFDPAHFHCTPSKTEHITAETAKWIKHVHVDNMPMTPAETTDCNTARLLPGDPASAYDLVDLFGRFERLGYKGNYAIEMFNDELWALSPAAACQKMFAAMQTVFSKLP